MKKVIVPCIAIMFLITACATGGPQTKTGKGAAYGAAIGGAAGAIAGQVIGKDTESTLAGAAIGAAIGGAAGAGVGKMMDNQEQEFRQALAASEAAAVHREGNLLAITLKGDVTFDTGSSTVKLSMFSELDRIAKILVQYPQTTISVEGHTDSVGPDESNIELSRRRAEAVKNLLVQRGVSASRIQVIPLGESQPIADNSTPGGRQLNRRVEIKVEPMAGASS